MDKISMLDMTWPEIEALAKQDAVVLWPLGVIEEHGPHLPLGTDIFVATRLAEATCAALRAAGRAAVVAPPMYWGVALGATAAFPGTLSVRPETLKALLGDAAATLKAAGFSTVVGINAHGDRVHVRSICEAFAECGPALGLRLYYQTFIDDCPGMGLTGTEPYIMALPPFSGLCKMTGPLADACDVHAGAFETAMMRECFPDLTDVARANELGPTGLTDEQLARWGTVKERTLTPAGYCGDPSAHARIAVDVPSTAEFLAAAMGDFLDGE